MLRWFMALLMVVAVLRFSAQRAGAAPDECASQVPVLGKYPFLGRLFSVEGARPGGSRGLPVLQEVPFVGRLYRVEAAAAADERAIQVPVLGKHPFLGRLFSVEGLRPGGSRGLPVLQEVPFVGRLYRVEAAAAAPRANRHPRGDR
jgi:hypothetical protein